MGRRVGSATDDGLHHQIHLRHGQDQAEFVRSERDERFEYGSHSQSGYCSALALDQAHIRVHQRVNCAKGWYTMQCTLFHLNEDLGEKSPFLLSSFLLCFVPEALYTVPH